MNHRMLRIFAGAAFALAASLARADQPLLLDAQFQAAGQAPMLLKAVDGAPFKLGRRVAITGFDIEFVTRGTAGIEAGKTVRLIGLGPVDFQRLVDALHADFVRELQAGGADVLPAASVAAAAAYRRMAASGSAAPLNKSGGGEMSTVYTAEARPVMGEGLNAKGPVGAQAGAASVKAVAAGAPALQKELDATLLSVRIVVDFIHQGGHSMLGTGGSLSPVIVPGATRIALAGAGGTVQYGLQRALQVDAAAIPEFKDAAGLVNVGKAALSFALGAKDEDVIDESVALADRGRYRELVGAALGTLRQLMLERIRSAP